MSSEFKDSGVSLHTVSVYAAPMTNETRTFKMYPPKEEPKLEVVVLDSMRVLRLAIQYAIESGIQESHDGNISPDLCDKISEHVAKKVLALLERTQ
jgi:hypothetical protein